MCLPVLIAAALLALAACKSKPVTDLVIRDGTTEILAHQYENIASLETVSIPDSVTKIGEYAFQKCTNLKSIVIPDSVTEVGMWAFYGCESLSEVTLPATAKYDKPFLDNPNLTAMTITGDHFVPNDEYSYGFMSSLVYQGNGTSPTLYGTLESVRITGPITTIAEGAFSGCWNLKSVELPDTVTRIESNAFGSSWESSLETIDLPDSVTEIGDGAFGWSGFTAIEIPDSVVSIGDRAFHDSKNLISVKIPPTVGSLGEGLFENCTALRLAVRDIFPTDFKNAVDVSGEEGRLIPEGARVVPMGEFESEEGLMHHAPWGILDSSLYNLMPEEVRSADWFTADYAIILNWEVHRDDSVTVITTNAYGTSVNSGSYVTYSIYLCGRDGTIRRIGWSYGKDGESVWKAIAERF